MKKTTITRTFFEKDTVEVAKELLGKIISFNHKKAKIIETEAYRGKDDLASHAAKGPTPRSQIMFGKPGFVYVYLIYGMHHCLNFTTEPESTPGAVLIRGVECLEKKEQILGPGKLTQYFGITLKQNGLDLFQSQDFYILNKTEKKQVKILKTRRIGIKKAQEKLWRFVLLENI